jgi:hypothetical protein
VGVAGGGGGGGGMGRLHIDYMIVIRHKN